MPELQVSVVLPYYLRLAEGDYQTSQAGEVVQVVAPLLLEGTVPCTSVCAHFTPEESADLDEIHKRRVRRGEQLLDVHTGCMQFHCVYAPRCPAETHLSRWVEPCSPPIESFLCP